MKRLTLSFLLCFCLGMAWLGCAPRAQAAALPDTGPGECNPFNADGTVKSSRECVCSDRPADANYCLDPTEYLQLKVSQNVGAALLSGMEKFTGLLWFVERLAVNFAQFALSGTLWTQIREAILGMLASILGGSGGVLDLIIRGPNGLFYLALVLAGIIMIVPFAIFGQRPVKVERVFLWGVFIIALFIGSTQGFDLIGAIETLRVNLMQTVLSGETVDLTSLVGAPMRATASEAVTVEEADPLALPLAFAATYFPGVENLEVWQFRVRVPTPLNNIIDVVFPGSLFQEGALAEASSQAVGGLLLALLTLVPATVLFLAGLILMLLTAASLVLIIFFVAALPLGFFEFGATILGGLTRQYMGIVLLSLFTAIFIRILAGLGVGIFGNDFSLSGMVFYLGGLGLVVIALQAALRQAWQALDGSLGMVQNAFVPVFASVGNLPSTRGPAGGAVEAGQQGLNTAVQTATMLAMGAATGGSSLLAALPGLMAGSQGVSGQVGGSVPTPPGALPAVAAAFPSAAAQGTSQPSPAGPAASPSAGAPVPTPTPATQVAQNTQDRHPPIKPPGVVPFVPAHDPAYVTPDLQGLQAAEHAYFDAGDQGAAQRLLAQGLGSTALAEAVLELYRTRGRQGATEVRQVIELTQATAATHAGAGNPVKDGHFTPAFYASLQAARGQTGLPALPFQDELTEASVRRLTPVEALPREERAELLAYAVAAPDDPLLMVEDAAAQYRLHDLSEKMGWEADKLKALFAHYAQALREAKRAGQPVPTTLAHRLQADPAFAGDRDATRQEAARLAAFVGEKAWIQLPTEAPASAPVSPASFSPAGPGSPVPTSPPSGAAPTSVSPTSPAPPPPAVPPPGSPVAPAPGRGTPAPMELGVEPTMSAPLPVDPASGRGTPVPVEPGVEPAMSKPLPADPAPAPEVEPSLESGNPDSISAPLVSAPMEPPLESGFPDSINAPQEEDAPMFPDDFPKEPSGLEPAEVEDPLPRFEEEETGGEAAEALLWALLNEAGAPATSPAVAPDAGVSPVQAPAGSPTSPPSPRVVSPTAPLPASPPTPIPPTPPHKEP